MVIWPQNCRVSSASTTPNEPVARTETGDHCRLSLIAGSNAGVATFQTTNGDNEQLSVVDYRPELQTTCSHTQRLLQIHDRNQDLIHTRARRLRPAHKPKLRLVVRSYTH